MEDLMGMLIGGEDFQKMGDALRMLTQHVCSALPMPPPVATAAPLSRAGVEWAPDGVDRISALPATLLRNIVSRLPVKDAARTTVLSRPWRYVWHSVPLVLVDAQLLPCDDLPIQAYRALAAHPGPFRCVYLTGTPMDAHRAAIAQLLRLLDAKGVQELTFVNRAQTMAANVLFPDTLFDCISLTRLYLGFWRFPVPPALPPRRTASIFLRLTELGLCAMHMDRGDLSSLLDKCPVLQKLAIVGSRSPVHIRVSSNTLVCVQLCSVIAPDIDVRNGTTLERLLLWEAWGAGCLADMHSRVNIRSRSNLLCLGILVPGMHKLEIDHNEIKMETKATSDTSVPSLQILAVQLRLGATSEAGMLPALLRCFPNLHTLYVQSEEEEDCHFREPTTALSAKFWQEIEPIQCMSRIKKVVFRGFHGKRSERRFINYIGQRAQVLEKLVVFKAAGCSAELSHKVPANWASGSCKLMVHPSQFEYQGTPWCYQRASALSLEDPFDVTRCLTGQCLSI